MQPKRLAPVIDRRVLDLAVPGLGPAWSSLQLASVWELRSSEELRNLSRLIRGGSC
jgi:hypothetical protein